DDRTERLALALPGLIEARRAALGRAAGGLLDPAAAVAAGRARLQLAEARLRAGLSHLVAARRGASREAGARLSPALLAAALREARARLEGLGARLAALSPEAVLARGYALVLDPSGRVLTRARDVKPAAALRLRFADGTVRAKAEGAAEPQGSLPF
ncbi:MAG TPA: exodeoxyribonuclease VII large subunit, partial [Acetobacteraceae bacterium]|nr:exodeoxyribonuclease VII large subunit [Acetobacteraceae bacterium]